VVLQLVGLSGRLITPHFKKSVSYEMLLKALDLVGPYQYDKEPLCFIRGRELLD
jgi:hypothetical protein